MKQPRLNVALVLETPIRQPDGSGGFRRIWQREGRLWAAMEAGSGGERLAEVGAKSVTSWRITTRAAPPGDPRRPRPEQVFTLGTRRFRILSVAERDPAGRYLTCHAQEEDLA